VIYVEAGDEHEALACFEEGLRHGGLAGVVAEIGRLSMTSSRRLQLAAEIATAEIDGQAIERLFIKEKTKKKSVSRGGRRGR
jgi:hypothetical protein